MTTMTITTTPVETPLGGLRETLAAALETEEQRFAALVAQHEDAVARIMQMLDLLDAPSLATNGASTTNGHGAATIVTNGAAPAPPAPEIDPTDVEVDLSEMTMEEAALTVMGTRRGQAWHAKDLAPIFRAAGLSDKVSSIAACLSIAYRHGKLDKAEPGQYILR